MITDILWSFYIILLFPFLYECEKIKHEGLKILLIGVLFTPVVGYLALYIFRKHQLRHKNTSV